ncbi:Acyl-coenzyme A thioesterase 8 [Escovopsis weberi]|uniref:Acyl-coenzyme A thioesterase 8 n=1 Tax=Escovopsis weberi TaxID=150374 RepID=A0A0M8N568_ESCWE|nr:Acyl-coenzyme A thioesterase 8 [Escovopsis weberi]
MTDKAEDAAREAQRQADEKLAQRTTLMRPPARDPGKAPIEHTVEVSELSVLGPDVFTNTRQPWVPRGARGIYGGTVIAQCLAAAQLTVPDTFLPHSCHCYFLLAGSGSVPILYHVERVRDGRSYATRTVQARQRGRCIFTTTISFARAGSGGAVQVRHAAGLPSGLEMPSARWEEEEEEEEEEEQQQQQQQQQDADRSPLQTRQVAHEGMHGAPDQRRCRRWIRCRGRVSEAGGHRAHLSALAYLSDSNLINTVARIHRLWRHRVPPERVAGLPEREQRAVRAWCELDSPGTAVEEFVGRPRVGMIVSLDHSIYFHEPARVRADEWMFTEMESPWSGDGRGVVMMRIFAKDGTLLASCVQEGVVRLSQDGTERAAKM